jgi:GAF domain-containing protein
MKTEDKGWNDLQRHAAAQLRPDFAHRVLRTAHAPSAAAWQQLQAHATAQLRPGFAERVLRAARSLPQLPSLFDQFAFSAITAAACLMGVLLVHARTDAMEEQRNLASWDQLAAEVQDVDLTQ